MIFVGHASLNIPNHRGDTPLSMLQSQIGSIWVSTKVIDIIKEHTFASNSRNILFKITKDRVNIFHLFIQLAVMSK
ncbi:hypothetical protein NQ314_001260 [Rhamnusium bicolor]|uniref:Uncharacterized protein n=1 Tax=Rhamnusium bicolor TaxID=1586634 RepID=A0AAV8ZTY6_9CUCU|nr:hypothetical protein NQ314_001260 [Rhamnusium bicolor]